MDNDPGLRSLVAIVVLYTTASALTIAAMAVASDSPAAAHDLGQAALAAVVALAAICRR